MHTHWKCIQHIYQTVREKNVPEMFTTGANLLPTHMTEKIQWEPTLHPSERTLGTETLRGDPSPHTPTIHNALLKPLGFKGTSRFLHEPKQEVINPPLLWMRHTWDSDN